MSLTVKRRTPALRHHGQAPDLASEEPVAMIDQLTFPAEIKARGDTGEFEGLASTFGPPPDLTGDVIDRGAFKDAVVKSVRMLWAHDTREPIGTWQDMRETKQGLEVRGKLILGVQRAREAFELIKAGAIDALSIGFRVPPGGSEIDRETGIRRLTKIDLMEVSIVTFPANPRAKIDAVKSALAAGQLPTRPDLQKALCSIGFSVRQAKKLLPACYEVLSPEEAERLEVLDGLRSLATTIKSGRSR